MSDNQGLQIQRELLGHLVAVGAISQAHFVVAMQLVDAVEVKDQDAVKGREELERSAQRAGETPEGAAKTAEAIVRTRRSR